MKFDVNLVGEDALFKNLERFNADIKDKILRQAMRDTTKPIEQAAKDNCRVDLGTLRDSISTKITAMGASKGTLIVGIVGPKTGVKVPKRMVRRGKRKGQVSVSIPTKYAANVEFGHKLVSDGKEVGQVPPYPFMRPAWDTAGGDKAIDKFCESMEKQIYG